MHHHLMRNYIAAILFCVTAALPVFAQEQDVQFPTASLTIKTQEKNIPLTVEVATSEAQQEHGLMFRKSLASDHGMIFDFGASRHTAFWMKNTLIPLDMVFIDNGGIITQIVERAEPESTRTIPSEKDVRAVLELAGGTAKLDHIVPGDRVIYSIFP